jgi:CHAD domain-containing protein
MAASSRLLQATGKIDHAAPPATSGDVALREEQGSAKSPDFAPGRPPPQSPAPTPRQLRKLEKQARAAKRLERLLSLERPGVLPDDPLAEAGRKVLAFHFAEMLRHEEGTRLGEDIEALHDMRVATRRMRAAFEVFESAFDAKQVKPHLKGLRGTGRALGRVRDLDVFMEKARHYLETRPAEERAGLDPLLDRWRAEREAGRAAMLAHLDGDQYAEFKRKFAAFLTTPGQGAKQAAPGEIQPDQVRHLAPVLIYTRLAAGRAYQPILAAASIEQLHALRIEFKKLRYTLEFFKEVLGKEVKGLINDLKVIQDHLGDLHDADVACGILRAFLDGWEIDQRGQPVAERWNPEPVVAYLAAKHAERHQLLVTFQDCWGRFDRPEFRQQLAAAVAVL